MKIILIDNGHGADTPGKRSPDGQFREYAYTREIADAVVKRLQKDGYYAVWLTPEEEDIPLKERVIRANRYCTLFGQHNVLLVSIHVNAAGKGDRWYNATGWSCYTSRGQTEGDKLADALYAEAQRQLPGHRIRTDYTDGDPDLESNFYVLRHSLCPAVLTENGYQDCKESLAFLESDAGKKAIINLHVNAIINYLNSKSL